MLNRTIFFVVCLILTFSLQSQSVYNTATSSIQVEASTSFLTVDADNKKVSSVLNLATGQLTFKGALKDFEFGMSGMSTLFTSKFAEHPTFRYEGIITDIAQLPTKLPGKYPINFKGVLHFGGKKRSIPGKGLLLIKEDGSVTAASDLSFKISEQTVKKMNDLIASYMPFGFGMSMERLGFSRMVKVVINGDYKAAPLSNP